MKEKLKKKELGIEHAKQMEELLERKASMRTVSGPTCQKEGI